jgi:hypothetical protein
MATSFDGGPQPRGGMRDGVGRRNTDDVKTFGAAKLADQVAESFGAQKSRF